MLCKPELNLTVVLTLVNMNNLILLDQKKNREYGVIGDFYQGILSKINQDGNSNCRFIPSYTIGGRLKNGTPYGALGHLIRHEADVYFRKEAPFFLDSENLLLSNPVGNDEIMITHLFRMKRDEQNKPINLLSGLIKFLTPSLIIYFCIATLLNYLIVTLFVIALNSFNYDSFKKGFSTFLCFFNFSSQNAKYLLSSMLSLYVAYKIILKFFEVLTFNSIKTNNVIVDTSTLILNLDDIWTTPKTICWMFGEIESFLFENSPKNSIMHKIWQEKYSESQPCYFSKNLNNEKIILNIEKYFMLSKKSNAHFLVRVMSNHIPIKLWLNDDFVLYEFFLSFYMKSSIDFVKRKWIDNTVNYYMQAGLMNPEVFLIFRGFSLNRKVVVTDLDSFIDENTFNKPFTMDDYFYYFRLFLYLQFFYLIMFCLHHTWNFLNQLFEFIVSKTKLIVPKIKLIVPEIKFVIPRFVVSKFSKK